MKVKVEEVRKVTDLLADEKQALWTILRSSFAHKLEYWLAMVHPSQVMEAAKEVDEIFHSVMEKLTGSHLPKEGGALDCTCCPTVTGLDTNIPGLPTTFSSSVALD